MRKNESPLNQYRDQYIGLISGTSSDGIDAALVQFDQNDTPTVVNAICEPLADDVRDAVIEMVAAKSTGLETFGELHIKLGKAFANAANKVCSGFDKSNVKAVGSHGQTIFHQPDSDHAFTLQIGCAATIAQHTGVTTIADFRSADIAAGGQGAPLAPAFHNAAFRSASKARTIINIGGLANVTFLADSAPVSGFDTGPGNGLMDAWTARHLQKPYDQNGEWAGAGRLNKDLLNLFFEEPYLKRQPPKSTGKELFNLSWLEQKLAAFKKRSTINEQDVQTTLAHFTAKSIVDSFSLCKAKVDELYVCGGGAANAFLMRVLQDYAKDKPVQTTQALGVHPDFVEAVTFAWLAKRRLENLPGNLTSVTGAHKSVCLGAIYPA